MRILLQRVARASVAVEGEVIASIGKGLLLLMGVADGDSDVEVRRLAAKVVNLRIFPYDHGRMNRSIVETGGEVLLVSQFTLYADVRKGRRPSFVRAAPPEIAEPLIECFATALARHGLRVQTGSFGAEMAVELINDGPVTIWLDSADLRS